MSARLGFAATALLAASAGWAGAPGTQSAEFLNLGFSARAEGMGDAFVAYADGPETVFSNPAGLAGVPRRSVSAGYGRLYEGLQFGSLVYAAPLLPGKVAMAVSGIHFTTGAIPKKTATTFGLLTGDDGSFQESDQAGMLSLAFRERWLMLGASGKFVTHTIDTYSARATAWDFGVLLDFPRLRIGASVMNVGGKLQFEEEQECLPQVAKAGAAVTLREDKSAVLAVEVDKLQGENPTLSLGSEYRHPLNARDNGFFRIGYRPQLGRDFRRVSAFTFGFGAQLSRFDVSYSFAPFGDLGFAHRISLTMSWATSPGSPRAQY